MEWIPVTERLPDRVPNVNYSQVLCLVTHDGKVKIRAFNHEYMVWDDEDLDDYYCEINQVTAWMELPEPYKETK